MSQTEATHSQTARRIFRDPQQQESFDRLGYVVGEFLDPDELAELNLLFDRTVKQGRTTYPPFRNLRYYISVFDADVGKRREVDRTVKRMFAGKLDTVMIDYRVLVCNFMGKEPGGCGEIQVHQDFTFVDEERFVGFNLWIPLEDTDLQNGCFYMIPGSHRLLRSYRAASVPDTLTKYNETLKRYMVPKPIKAGTGLLFDHRLFHYSPDNQSDRWRPAVQLVVIPAEADPLVLQYDTDRDPEHLLVRRVDEDFLTEGNLWEPPKNVQVVGRKPYIRLPEEAELVRMVEGLRAEAEG